jgi:SOS-response transcriptional repressor LexA
MFFNPLIRDWAGSQQTQHVSSMTDRVLRHRHGHRRRRQHLALALSGADPRDAHRHLRAVGAIVVAERTDQIAILKATRQDASNDANRERHSIPIIAGTTEARPPT